MPPAPCQGVGEGAAGRRGVGFDSPVLSHVIVSWKEVPALSTSSPHVREGLD